MRYVAFLMLVSTAAAQDNRIPSPGSGQPAPALPAMPVPARPVANPKDAFAKLPPALQGHLLGWEKRTREMQSLYVEVNRKLEQTVAKKTSSYTGSIRCMKPNLAYLRIDNAAKRDEFSAFICDGRDVYEYQGADKTVVKHAIPAGGQGNVGDNLLLEFMSGSMTAADVAARFDMSLLKEDQYYVYIEVKPLSAKDQQEFESLILVLYGPNVDKVSYLPARVQMKNNGGQLVDDWTFSKHVVNPTNIKAGDFAYVAPPKDWTVKNAEKKPVGKP